MDTLVFGALAVALSLAVLVVALRRGRGRGRSRSWWLRWTGLALLPFGLWASGLARLGYRLADASVDFLVNLTFNPLVWTGFGTLLLSAGLLFASWRARRSARREQRGEQAAVRRAPTAVEQRRAPATRDDDGIEGMDEIEAILRKRGIS